MDVNCSDAAVTLVTGTNGVVVAQGGRFGGWSLYTVRGIPHYAYNFVGRDQTVVRGARPMTPGRHDLVVRFDHCVVRFSTHSAGGISVNDFICAAKADSLVAFLG